MPSISPWAEDRMARHARWNVMGQPRVRVHSTMTPWENGDEGPELDPPRYIRMRNRTRSDVTARAVAVSSSYSTTILLRRKQSLTLAAITLGLASPTNTVHCLSIGGCNGGMGRSEASSTFQFERADAGKILSTSIIFVGNMSLVDDAAKPMGGRELRSIGGFFSEPMVAGRSIRGCCDFSSSDECECDDDLSDPRRAFPPGLAAGFLSSPE
mmetsp:Transcript_51721/g.62201  ORF Transcript_51721/g.62201 Transcript_51721/m.62201 type:complete len:212 (-) Transcript_51721:174-809(-)